MAKELTEEQKKEKKLKKLAVYYDNANDELNLEGKSIPEQIHILVNACLSIQCEICKMSDSIKIDDLSKVQELTYIDKSTYLDFVNICALKNNDKLKDKAIDKFENDFNNKLIITNLRHSFLESFMSGEELKITDEDNYEYKPFSDYKSEEFEKIMENSANKREYINTVLYKRYKEYAKAAEYLTKLELKYKDFKNLVDWEYYKEGGYPSESTPAKLWAIFNKYDEALRLMNKYEFTQQDELNKEFGLNVELKTPNPVEHPWLREKEKEID